MSLYNIYCGAYDTNAYSFGAAEPIYSSCSNATVILIGKFESLIAIKIHEQDE